MIMMHRNALKHVYVVKPNNFKVMGKQLKHF